MVELNTGVNFGDWLKAMRQKKGMSLRALAEAAGVSHVSVDKAERGGGVRDSTLELLVGALVGPDAGEEEARELLLEARRVRAGLSEIKREPDEEELQRALMAYTGDNPVLSAAKSTAEAVAGAMQRAGAPLTGEEPNELIVRGRRKGITAIDE